MAKVIYLKVKNHGNKGMIGVTKAGKSMYIDKNDLDEYIQNGWATGNPKAANKGKANRFLWKSMY